MVITGMIHGLAQTIFKMSPVEKNKIFHISTSIYDNLKYLPLSACWGTTHHKHVLTLDIYIYRDISILMTNNDVGEQHKQVLNLIYSYDKL